MGSASKVAKLLPALLQPLTLTLSMQPRPARMRAATETTKPARCFYPAVENLNHLNASRTCATLAWPHWGRGGGSWRRLRQARRLSQRHRRPKRPTQSLPQHNAAPGWPRLLHGAL